jgi:hypothetical protein
MVRLRALRPMSYPYNTRQMRAGEIFSAPKRDARILVATRGARVVRDEVEIQPPDPKLEDRIIDRFAPETIKALRAEYESIFHKRPFMGWTADTLQEKIAASRG